MKEQNNYIFWTPVKQPDYSNPMDSDIKNKSSSALKCYLVFQSDQKDFEGSNVKPGFSLDKKPVEENECSPFTKIIKEVKNENHNDLKENYSQNGFLFLHNKRNLSSVFETIKSIKTPEKVFKIYPVLSNVSTNEKTIKKGRFKKSNFQIHKLNTFYEEHNGKWEKEEIFDLAEKLELSEKKVYKWLWDRRAIDERKKLFKITKTNEESA